MSKRTTPQAKPIDVLITDLHELHIRKKFERVDTISNMQLSDLNSKPHCRKSLRDIIGIEFGFCFYPPTGSEHYTLLLLNWFYGSTHINYNTVIIIRRKLCDVYNMLHPNCTGNFRTKMYSMTM